jgi:hypothetical protein
MIRRLYFFIVIFLAAFFSTTAGYGQCLTIPTTSQDVSCFGGNDGEISLTINAGTPPNAQPPWDIELFFEDSGGGLTSLAFYNDVTFTSIIFTPGNGSLNIIGADAFGIPANDFIDPGSRYRIEVRSTGGLITCRNKVAFVTINQPTQLQVTLNNLTPDCDPTLGTGNGGIDITPSGGVSPYTVIWTGPTAIPNGTLVASNLDAGSYTVDVTDVNNCLTSLNINVPITTQADAGPPTALVCGVNSLVLSANAAGAGEIGTWSGPPGVVFSNVNDPSATVTNLNVGLNTLTWTIQDIGLICPGTTDNIDVRYSDVQMSGTPDVLLNCFGDTNGAGTFTVTGGSANYTYSIIANTSLASIILPAPGPTLIVSFTGAGAGVVTLQVLDGNGCTSQATINITQPAAAVTAPFTQVNVSCFGGNDGSITITPAGGVGPYDFSMDGGATFPILNAANHTFTTLTANTYNIQVRDANNCLSVIVPVTITQPAAAVTAPFTQVNVSCFGGNDGSITITPAGGVGPYDFSMDGGATFPILNAANHTFTTLTANTYNIQVRDANNCLSVIVPVTITQPAAAVTAPFTQVNVSCFGGNDGSITITPAGGVGPYDFSMDGGATFPILNAANHTFTTLTANTYNIQVRDANNCLSVIVPVTITQPAAAVTAPFTQVNVSCFGGNDGSITITPAGGVGPYDFSMDGGATFPILNAANHTFTTLTANTYNIQVRDANNCLSVIVPVTITQPAAAVTAPFTQVNVSCFGGNDGSITITPAGGVGPYDFSMDGGATFPILNAANHTFTTLTANTYNIQVRDANNCLSVIVPVTITQPAAAVTAPFTQVNVSCFGGNDGSITITPAGGVGPYDFSMDGGATFPVLNAANHTFTTLTANTYNIQVRDANNCLSVIVPVTITQPAAAVTAPFTQVNVSCFGGNDGSITITPAGGVGPYDFSMDGGATFPILNAANHTFTTLTANTYNIQVRDANNCLSVIVPVTITQPAAAVTAPFTQVNVSCFGGNDGSITITPAGGVGPYDFSMDGGATFPILNAANHTFTTLTANTYNIQVRDANNCLSVIVPVTITQPAAAVTAPFTQVNVSCFGGNDGSITITPAGGVGPYDFSMDGGATFPILNAANHTFTTLTANTYNIQVRDANNCLSVIVPVTITQPAAAVTAPFTQVNVSCFGGNDGSITITPAGGVGPYDFSMDGGATFPILNAANHTFTTLTANTYNIQVRDANNCLSVIVPVTITQPAAAVTAPFTQVNVSCFGGNDGSITITPAGGVGPYDFSMDGGATFPVLNAANHTFTTLTANTYNIQVRDANNCLSAIVPVTITQPAQAVSGVLSGNASICVGQSTGLTITFADATGPTWDFVYSDGSSTFNLTANSNPFTFTVNPVITTTYSLVSLIDATCGAGTVSGVVTVTVNPIPGDQVTFGNETWIGYVYDDSSSPFPPVSNINFSGAKYRGYIEATDIDNMSASSTYEVPLDTFDMNVGAAQIFGPNVCGTYANDFSVRYKMRKTFAAGVYSFTVGADDGVRLFVDGVNVITAPGAFFTHSYTEFTSAPICLTAGTHDLIIEYFERGGDARMSFTYSLVPPPTLTTTTPLDVCVNSATPTLSVSSSDPSVIDFNWYTDAALTNLVFTGANYTPASTELDMTVAGSADFFVTAIFTGGCESPSNMILVNVVNGAILTLPPTDICESGGIIDLTTIVSASPTGGTFTFAGTGVTGNNFDPTSLSGLIAITVDYTVGGCSAPTGTLNLTVTNTAAITVPGTAIQACETAGTIDLLTLVSGTPGGGVFSFAGPQVTGNIFDPTGLSGVQTILVDYSAGGCVAPQAQFDIDVSSTASLTITNSNVCQNGGVVNLLSYVSATPTGGVFSFSGTGVTGSSFNPAGLTGPISISDYVYGCV